MDDDDLPLAAIDAATDEVTRWMLEYDWMTGLNAKQVRKVTRDTVYRAFEAAALAGYRLVETSRPPDGQ